jgi:hypothetical protein
VQVERECDGAARPSALDGSALESEIESVRARFEGMRPVDDGAFGHADAGASERESPRHDDGGIAGGQEEGTDEDIGARVRAMMAARARRGQGGLELEAEVGDCEEVGDVSVRRARLGVGSWAGPRVVARQERLRFSKEGVARREKRAAAVRGVVVVLVFVVVRVRMLVLVNVIMILLVLCLPGFGRADPRLRLARTAFLSH